MIFPLPLERVYFLCLSKENRRKERTPQRSRPTGPLRFSVKRALRNSRGAPHVIALEQVLAILPFYLAILGTPNGGYPPSFYNKGCRRDNPHRCSRDAQHTIPEVNAKLFEEACRRQPLSKQPSCLEPSGRRLRYSQ